MFFSKVVLFAISLGTISVLANPHVLHHRAVAARARTTLTPSSSDVTVSKRQGGDKVHDIALQVFNATVYTPGDLNACNLTDSEFKKPTDLVVSVAPLRFDNPKGFLCGRKITIANVDNIKNTSATIVDRCATCSDDEVGLTAGVFASLGASNAAKVFWFFSDSES